MKTHWRTKLFLAVSSVLLAQAQLHAASAPVIDHVLVSISSNLVTLQIYGSGFGTTLPTVTMDGAKLSVSSFSNTLVTAVHTGALPSGSYDLLITDAATALSDGFAVSTDVQGPQGPAGPAGAAGRPPGGRGDPADRREPAANGVLG